MICLGIDPGYSGGIAAVYGVGKAAAWKMPATERDFWAILTEKVSGNGGGLFASDDLFAILEQVHSMPKQGVVSSFTFGTSYGVCRMGLIAAGIPFEEVTPQQWQGAMKCLSGGDKNVTKRRAQELFPGLTITHAIADALLIAEYCRRLKTGEIAA